MAEEGSPGYPMYIKFSTLRAGSKSVISAHCNMLFVIYQEAQGTGVWKNDSSLLILVEVGIEINNHTNKGNLLANKNTSDKNPSRDSPPNAVFSAASLYGASSQGLKSKRNGSILN